MKNDYDCVIVGGGIAGLMVAVRAAACGLRVGLFEKNRLGSQASTGNHGMIHSGALYVELHPNILTSCREAVGLFASTFPNGLVSRQRAWYFGSPAAVGRFRRHWDERGFDLQVPDRAEAAEMFRSDRLGTLDLVALDDLTVSSRAILVDLVLIGWKLGVEIHVHSPVTEVLVEDSKAIGLRLGSHETVSAGRVVLCSGLGTQFFAERLGLSLCNRLKSRLDVMVAYRGNGLERSLLSLELGGPTIAPALNGKILASLFGGVQRPVREYHRWSVPIQRAQIVTQQVRGCFRKGLVQLDTATAYMCSKTEVACGHANSFGSEPGIVVSDHGREDGIANLWSLIPGKMTLAFHASRNLVSQMLDTGVALPLPSQRCSRLEQAQAIVEHAPWQPVEAED